MVRGAGPDCRPANTPYQLGGCGHERRVELARLHASGMAEPTAVRCMGPDVDGCHLFQCAGWIRSAKSQRGILVASGAAACYFHRFLSHSGNRHPARTPHSCETTKSPEPLSIPTLSVMGNLGNVLSLVNFRPALNA